MAANLSYIHQEHLCLQRS